MPANGTNQLVNIYKCGQNLHTVLHLNDYICTLIYNTTAMFGLLLVHLIPRQIHIKIMMVQPNKYTAKTAIMAIIFCKTAKITNTYCIYLIHLEVRKMCACRVGWLLFVPKVKWNRAKMTIFIQHYDRNGKTIAVIKIQNNDNLMALLLCSFSPVRLLMFTVLFFWSFNLAILAYILPFVYIYSYKKSFVEHQNNMCVCNLAFICDANLLREQTRARFAQIVYRLRFRCPSCQQFAFAIIFLYRLSPFLWLPKIVYSMYA